MFNPNNSNLEFSKQINILKKQIQEIKNSNKKIALYGFGIIGKYIFSQIKENVVLIIDKEYTRAGTYSGLPIDNPNNIHKYKVQNILISILGREEEIIKYLIKSKDFDRKDIITFNLKVNNSIINKLKYKIIAKKSIIIKYIIAFEPILTVLYIPLSFALYLTKYKLLYNFRFTGFGHYGMEPLFAYYDPKYSKYKKIMLVNEANVPNKYLLNLWKQKYLVISNEYIFHILWPLYNYSFLRINSCGNRSKTYDRNFSINKDVTIDDNNDAYFNRIPKFMNNIIKYKDKEESPLIIPKSEIIKAKQLVKEHLDIKENEKFVILHIRNDVKYDSTRSIKNIQDYIPALKYLKENNIKIVMLGTNKTLNKSIKEYVINYPNSEIKSDFIDIYLMSESLFYIGASSGPMTIAPLFKTPIFVVNAPCFSTFSFNPGDIYLPILIQKNQKIVSIKNYLKNNLMWLYNDTVKKDIIDFEKYSVIENSPKLIYDGVVEMIKMHYFKEPNNFNTLLQDTWRNSFPKLSLNNLPTSFVVNSFLIKYNKELYK